MFGRRNNKTDRIENLLERVTAIQERQQTTADRHEGNFERTLKLIEQSNQRTDRLYEEIKGLRTESLRIQRHIFGDEVDEP